jgi:hypothetical protein
MADKSMGPLPKQATKTKAGRYPLGTDRIHSGFKGSQWRWVSKIEQRTSPGRDSVPGNAAPDNRAVPMARPCATQPRRGRFVSGAGSGHSPFQSGPRLESKIEFNGSRRIAYPHQDCAGDRPSLPALLNFGLSFYPQAGAEPFGGELVCKHLPADILVELERLNRWSRDAEKLIPTGF